MVETQEATKPQDEIPASKKVTGFFLTLVVIPLLFVGTCVPFGFLGMGLAQATRFRGGEGQVVSWFAFFGIAFLAIAIRKAVKTQNPGTRLAIIIWSLVLAVGGLLFLFQVR